MKDSRNVLSLAMTPATDGKKMSALTLLTNVSEYVESGLLFSGTQRHCHILQNRKWKSFRWLRDWCQVPLLTSSKMKGVGNRTTKQKEATSAGPKCFTTVSSKVNCEFSWISHKKYWMSMIEAGVWFLLNLRKRNVFYWSTVVLTQFIIFRVLNILPSLQIF